MPVEHEAPRPFPHTHYVGLAIPADLAKVIQDAAEKNDRLFHDQLIYWVQQGAECERLCKPKTAAGRRTRK